MSENAATRLRSVDVQHPTSPGVNPPDHLMVDLAPSERVVSVETVKESFGYASARVWIVEVRADV